MKLPFQGIIFDFDGILVDTEWAIYQSWVRIFRREGQRLPMKTYSPCLGAGYSYWDPARHLEKLTGKTYDWDVINKERQARIESDLDSAGLMPGALELLDLCDEYGIGMAVASSSSRRWVGGWLQKLGIEKRFRGVFCRTDGYPPKPDPALYRAAIECLGVPACHCLALEDSDNGLKSASLAGAFTVAIPNRLTRHSCNFAQALTWEKSLATLAEGLRGCCQGTGL